MNASDRYAAIGGTAGFLAVVVSIIIAILNHRSTQKQLTIASKANETARLAVEGQQQANTITKLSVDDQLEGSRRARTASVRIVEATMSSRELAEKNGDLGRIEWIYPDTDYHVMTLVLINEGTGPAYKVKLTPVAV